MSQAEKARRFAALHVRGDPVLLYNIWDAGGAKAIADAGAAAVATGSMSLAAAHGYGDGQHIPLDLVLRIVSRIVATVDLPVTVDFEGGYAESPEALTRNAASLIATGAVGVNFEDRVVDGAGLYPIARQCERIAAIRRAADAADVPLFINARTDLFLSESDKSRHCALLAEATDRAVAYAQAGADGFFVPGLADATLLTTLCDTLDLPVNAMRVGDVPDRAALAALGIARVSFGPAPYFEAMAGIRAAFGKV